MTNSEPGWLFIFVLTSSIIILLTYFLIDTLAAIFKKNTSFFNLSKLILIIILLAIFILIPIFSDIDHRLRHEGYGMVHDGIIQTEQALEYLLEGKNFYTENYSNAPIVNLTLTWLENTLNFNPAQYHYVYLPFYVFFSVPFYLFFNIFFHWYDQRVVLIFTLFVLLGLVLKMGKLKEKTLVIIILLFLNPLFLRFFNEGRNDIFFIFWILLALYFLLKGRIRASSIPLALAILSKQSAWLLLPFYWFYIYYNLTLKGSFINKIKDTVKLICPLFLIIVVVLIPFLIWDAKSFWEDIVLYINGNLPSSYPISGYGLSSFLLQAKLGVKTMQDYFPFWILQLIFGIPLILLLFKAQKKNNTLSQMMFNYGLFLFVFWFFSRFFNDNYLNVLAIIFTLAYFLKGVEKNHPAESYD